jgi:hypothetical protein
VKSKGCSSEPASASTWNWGRRLLRTTFTWCSDFSASSAAIFTWRLLSSARDSAASSVRSGSGGSCEAAAPCANDLAGQAAAIDRKKRTSRRVRRRSDAIGVRPGAGGQSEHFMGQRRGRNRATQPFA